MDRNTALEKLLQPIRWDLSSSIRARQNLVESRHKAVNQVIPFLFEDELVQVNKWIKENKHSGLWD